MAGLSWDDPWPALDDLCGRYAILFLADDSIRVAHDAFGSRCLFYKPGLNAISSHANLLGTAYHLSLSSSVAEFIERPEYKDRTVQYLPGDLTAYDEVYSLIPNNYWNGCATIRYWPREACKPVSKNEFLSQCRRYFEAFVPFVRSGFIPVFGLTGGIDSRAVFAAFEHDFLGTTWTHYFPPEERPIVSEIVDYLGIDYRQVHSKDYAYGTIAEAATASTGGIRVAHRTVEGMAAMFPEPGLAFIRGYGGEILRGFIGYRSRLTDLSPERMTHAYGSSIRKAPQTRDYIEFCNRAFEEYRERANYAGIERFGYENMDLFYWEHRMGTWASSMMDEMDPAMMSLVGFNSRKLFVSAFGVDENVRLKKSLLKQVIALYDTPLSEIRYV